MVEIEGVDYSATANGDWTGLANALNAAGKHFVGRYAVGDKSPGGRGITAAEYNAMKAAGIDVFLYWQTTTSWMQEGWDAGVRAAQNAQANINGAGMPANTPVYFACDFDATEGDQDAIDDCLRGAASVIGFERVGLYAGYWPLSRARDNGTARWFCQTGAWSGGNLMSGVHLYQYDNYGNYIYGTDVDLVRAYAENYGQATPPTPPPPPPPKYPTPRPVPADVLAGHDFTDAKGTVWRAIKRNVHVKPGTKFYVNASTTSKESRSPAGPNGMTVEIAAKVNSWYVTPRGSTFKIADADVAVSFKG